MKKIIKISAEINETETEKTVQNIDETNSWFFEKTNKTDKLSARLIEKKRQRTQIKSEMKKKLQLTLQKYKPL